MRYTIAATAFALLALLCAGLSAQQAPTVTMSWQMPSTSYTFRDAHLVAYPVAASDFVVPLRVAYLGDLDAYIWQFRAKIPEAYQKGDWVLAGYEHGWVVAQRFQVEAGATARLSPVEWRRPQARPHLAGQPVTVDYEKPAVDESVVQRWEVLQDGRAIPMDPAGHGEGDALNQVRVTGLRLVLVGGPKEHAVDGPTIEVAPDVGDRL